MFVCAVEVPLSKTPKPFLCICSLGGLQVIYYSNVGAVCADKYVVMGLARMSLRLNDKQEFLVCTTRGECVHAGPATALQSRGEACRSHTSSELETVSESSPAAPPSLQPLLTSAVHAITDEIVCVCVPLFVCVGLRVLHSIPNFP